MRRYDGEEIYKAIPNRYPWMILNTLIVEEGVKASGYVKLSPDGWFFQCHFPGMPVFPATLLVETMTQVFISTFLEERMELNSADAWEWKPEDIPLLIQVSGFKMKRALHPGDSVRIDACLHSFKRGIARGICKAFQLGGDAAEKETLVTEFEVSHALPSLMSLPQPGGES